MTTGSPQTSSTNVPSPHTYQLVGRALGPLVFLTMMLLGQSQEVMSTEAWRVAAAGLWMAIWWSTEAVPVPVTALLPLIVFAPLGITSMREAAAPYANPTIFLFMGGFIMALALERCDLHRRIALAVVDKVGTNGRQLVGGFMFVCALLSMWMTNTSTTMMLLPIVLSIAAVISDNVPDLTDESRKNFKIAMCIGNSNQYHAERIPGRLFLDTGRQSRLSKVAVVNIFVEIIETLDSALQATIEALPYNFPDDLVNSISAAIKQRLPRLPSS